MSKIVFSVCVLLVLCVFKMPVICAQGCSDAGICSAGGMLPGSGHMEKGSVTLNMQYGVGEQNVKIITPQLEGKIRLNKRNSFQLKLPYVIADGNLGRNNGIGDVIALISHQFYDTNQRRLNLNAGFRIGVNAANKFSTTPATSSLLSLPMPYQNSLGTHDFLIGVDYTYKERWLFALGLQVPFYQFNRNDFDTSKLLPSETNGKQYFSSDHLMRRPDVILRTDRIMKVNDHVSFSAGALLIYHTLHDRAINAAGKEVAIHGSKGSTLNIPVSITYKFNSTFSCTFRFASPVIVRKVRPDGLTRHYVVGLELKYSFNKGAHAKTFKPTITPDF